MKTSAFHRVLPLEAGEAPLAGALALLASTNSWINRAHRNGSPTMVSTDRLITVSGGSEAGPRPLSKPIFPRWGNVEVCGTIEEEEDTDLPMTLPWTVGLK